MALVPIRIDWTSKPPIGTPLRTDGHWSVQDLLICSVFNEGGSTPLELVNGKWMPITYGTGTSSQWSPDGLQLISNVTTNASPTVEYVSIGSTKCLSVVEGSVVQVVKNLGATSGDQGTFQAGASHRRWILHQTTNASTFNLTIVLASGVYKYIASAVPRNITIVQGMTWRNGGENGAGYINGKAGVIWAGAAVQTEVFASIPLHGNCEHDFLATYSKSLTTDQMASISASPWQVFEPKIVWVELGGGTQTYTENLASLADTYSGVAAIATFLDAGQTIVAAGVSADGTVQMLDSILSTAQSAGAVIDLAQRTDALLAVIQAADSVQAVQSMVDTLVSSASAQIDVADSQLSAGSEILQTAVTAAATVQDVVVALERFSATASAQASVVDEQISAAAEHLLTAAQGISGVADLQLMVDNLTIIAQSTASLTEISSYLDQLASAATGAASVSDTLVAAFVGRYIFRDICTPRRFSDQVGPRRFADQCRPRGRS